jgi:hypothetical protein
VNRYGAARAQYLAESGIEIGVHFLMYPPTSVPPGSYWHGASGIAIDATSDYTNVGVLQDVTDSHLFTLTAVGVSHHPDGSVRGKHKILVELARPPNGKWYLPYALIGSVLLNVPSTVEVYGDLHVNGSLLAQCWCRSDVTATEGITWAGTGPPASITPFSGAVTVPPVDATLYAAYAIRGNNYTAYTGWPKPEILAVEAVNLNALDWSVTNPGRIILPPVGSFTLHQNVQINGTLVVQGDLIVDGLGVLIVAETGYPALVVTGDIVLLNDGTAMRVEGAVLCGGRVSDVGYAIGIEAHGPFMAGGGFDTAGGDDLIRLFDDPVRRAFWNLAISGEVRPVTLLSWTEN